MAQRLISFRWVDLSLVTTVRKMPEAVEREVRKVVERTIKRVFDIVKFSTPVDSGRAIGAWRMEVDASTKTGKVINDTPWINVLEFGGYPVRKDTGTGPGFVRGAARLGGLPPGPRTRAFLGGEPAMANNVSAQAVSGMVRKALGETEDQFEFDLAEAIERAWEGA